MKFDIKNRFTGDVQFAAEIDCKEGECNSVKIGRAVKWALRNNANLYGADLYGADLRGADLYGADLHGTNLYGADLHGTNLYGANLHGASLHGANLYGADLYGANLRGASLHGANLRGASLHGADLYGANLRGASLYGADLYGADLYGASLHGTKGIVSFSGVGKASRFGFVHQGKGKPMCQLGCFYGTAKEALVKVSDKYGSRSSYASMIRVAIKCLKEQQS